MFKYTRRKWLAAAGMLAAALCVTPATLRAFDGEAFEEKMFVEAQKAGRPILIEVSAAWCPVCKVQAKILNTLFKQPDIGKMLRIVVEYDIEKDVLKRFNVTKQSTLIAFKGTTETARSVGDSSEAGIEKLVRSAL